MLFTSLHRLLGLAPGPISDEMIDRTIAARLAETDDLDWKGELPPTRALNETDFPKDVAAMANSGGGVIVYGIEEMQKRATGRSDVGELTENHERTLRAAAYNAVTPPVFGLGIYRVGEPGNRVVVVVVPSSVDGPHLIFKDKFFGAPLRNDADTEWMKERQIEAAYRARLDERRQSTERLNQLYREATASWGQELRAVIVAVAHPRTAAFMSRVDRTEARSIFTNAESLGLSFAGRGGVHPLDSIANNPRPGLRRWVGINTATTDKTIWRSAWASIHDDGSVSMVATVGGHRAISGGMMRDSQVDSSAIECAVADFMALLRTWSRKLGTGEYDVRVGIEWRAAKPLLIQTVDQSGHPYDGTSVPLNQYLPVEASVDAAAADLDFFWRVHDLAEDCVNQGGVSNVRTISPPPRNGSSD